MAGASILATICAERLTKFIAHYSRTQAIFTRRNAGSGRRLLVMEATKRASSVAPSVRKYASVWQQPMYRYQLHRPTLEKPKRMSDIYGQSVPAVGPKTDAANPLQCQGQAQFQSQGQQSQVSNWLRRLERPSQLLTQAKLAALPKVQQQRFHTLPTSGAALQKAPRNTEVPKPIPPSVIKQQEKMYSHPVQKVPVLARYAFAGANAMQPRSTCGGDDKDFCRSFREQQINIDRLKFYRDCY